MARYVIASLRGVDGIHLSKEKRISNRKREGKTAADQDTGGKRRRFASP